MPRLANGALLVLARRGRDDRALWLRPRAERLVSWQERSTPRSNKRLIITHLSRAGLLSGETQNLYLLWSL